MSIKEGLDKTREILPKEAFAIVGNPDNQDTWRLPHHRKNIVTALRRKTSVEGTVDWEKMAVAVAALSPVCRRRQRLNATPEQILQAARHLAGHYRSAGRKLPDILAALL